MTKNDYIKVSLNETTYILDNLSQNSSPMHGKEQLNDTLLISSGLLSCPEY